MGDTSVQVKSAPIFGAFGCPVPERNAVTYRHTVRLEGPDTHRAVADAGHIPAIVRGGASLNEDITAISHYNAIPTVIGQVGRVTRIIFCPAVLYKNMITVVRPIGAFYGNSCIAIVPGRCAEDLYVGRLVNIYSRLLKAIHKQVAGYNMATGVEDKTAFFITVLSACSPKLQVGQRDISCLVQRHGKAIAPIDHGIAWPIRGNDNGTAGGACDARRQLQRTLKYYSPAQEDGIAKP